MQQCYGRASGVIEIQSVNDLVEDALHIHQAALQRHRVRLIRQLDPIAPMPIDKHKVLQILVNLISNAKYALSESNSTDRLLTIATSVGHFPSQPPSPLQGLQGERGSSHSLPSPRLRIVVADNGVGISQENLTRIFSHGFSTRPSGHGFGLHSSALSGKDMGGALVVHSDGPLQGARFTLLLPIDPKASPQTPS